MVGTTARVLVTVGLAGVLAGCGLGGGDAGDEEREVDRAAAERADQAAATYREALGAYARAIVRVKAPGRPGPEAPEAPRLTTVDGTSDAYETARQIAERATPIMAEAGRVATAGSRADSRLYLRGYDIASDLYGERLDIALDNDIDGADIAFDNLTAPPNRIASLKRPVTSRALRRYRKAYSRASERVARQPARTALQRSAFAFQRAEYDLTLRRVAETRRLQREAPDSPEVERELQLLEDHDAYPVVVGSASKVRRPLLRGFAASLRSLAAVPDLPADVPTAGDAYRKQIVAQVRKPRETKQAAPESITSSLWMLQRIQELDKTPEDAYQAARATVVAFNGGDARNPYQAMFSHVKDAQIDGTTIDAREKRLFRNANAWVTERLAEPRTPALTEPLDAYVAELAEWPLEGRGRQLSTAQDKAVKRLTRIALRAARNLDDVELMRRTLRTTVAATKPQAPAE